MYHGLSSKLAVPRADKNQPLSRIPIWGNGKIQVLQHREYGAERYIRLLVGWDLNVFVVAGNDVVERRPDETKMLLLSRMLQCSFQIYEGQPLLILHKVMTFEDVLGHPEGQPPKDVTSLPILVLCRRAAHHWNRRDERITNLQCTKLIFDGVPT